MKTKVVSLTVVLVTCLLMGVMGPYLSGDADAQEPLTITDGLGNEFEFDKIPSKIATIGAGFTATAIELGLLDKIVVCDKYSKGYTNEVYNDLKVKIDNGDVLANGSDYSAGNVKSDLLAQMEKYDFGLDDIVIFCGSDSIRKELDKYDLDFKYVLCWKTASSYDDIVDCIRSMSLITLGKIDERVNQMNNIVSEIDSVLFSNPNVKPCKAVYLTSYNGEFKVGNEGSLGNSLIIAAGGVPLTVNKDITTSTYAITIPTLIDEYGDDMILFLDNALATNEDQMSKLKSELEGKDIKMVHMSNLWNNYAIDSMEGVWTMACAMYPDLFEGDVPTIDNEEEGSVGIYVAIGIVGALIVAVLAFIFLKKH